MSAIFRRYGIILTGIQLSIIFCNLVTSYAAQLPPLLKGSKSRGEYD